ncbi:MAG: hypothetical protein OHK0026_04100 [Rhodocyclaceae bacterium]
MAVDIARRLYSFVVSQKCVPWSVSHRFEVWREGRCYHEHPALYQLLRFGRISDIVRPLTVGPKHHFFGYYEKSPWNASETLILAHEASFNDRAPTARDSVAIGVIRPHGDGRFEAIAESAAWNWQQGTMLQWHPADPERLLVHNDRREGAFVAVVRDTSGKEVRVYDRPIYALAPDGLSALTLNFARLAVHRPGYGYAGGTDSGEQDPHPREDGIHRLDLKTGRADLIVPLARLAALDARPEMQGVHHWVNHIQINPSGTRFAFFHIWRVGSSGWAVRFYTARMDGSDLRCLLDTGTVSHYDWMDDEHIFVWARAPEVGERFLLCDLRDGAHRVIGEGILTVDGHGSFSPDRRWILNDTYPDTYGIRTLMLFRPASGRRIDLARLYSPKDRWWGEIRCDLHPRWNRSGTQVCLDSVHDGTRQMYVADVERHIR